MSNGVRPPADNAPSPAPASGAATPLTSVLPRWMVISLAVLSFLIMALLLVGPFLNEELRITVDTTPRELLSLCLAFFGAIFFFTLYPQEIVIKKVPIINLPVQVVGPAVLMGVLFALFWYVLPERQWTISDTEASFYLFARDGEKYDRKFTVTDAAGKERLGIEPIADDALRETPRKFVSAEEKLYVQTSGGTYLGYTKVTDLPEGLLAAEDQLRLGLYFAECLSSGAAGVCERRRNAPAAVKHLVEALQRTPLDSQEEEEKARDVLYGLMGRFDRCEQYDALLNALQKADPDYRSHPMAEAYLHLYRNRQIQLAEDQKAAFGRAALGYFLQFLGGLDSLEEPQQPKVRSSIKNARELAPKVLAASGSEVLQALDARVPDALANLSWEIAVEDEKLRCTA